jgi:deoxyribonucleoside regulator
MSENRDELLARVAGLYYEDGWTQEQISAQLGYSRSAISRLLTEARRTGIVEIYVHRPLERVAGLEQRLRAGFDLEEVRVLRSQGLAYAEMLRRLGALGGRWLEEILTGRSILGISWGTALYEVANALRPSPITGVRVVQIIGSATSRDHEVDGPGLARAFARRLDGQYYTLPAPWLVDDSRVKAALLEDRRIREILDLAAQADVALVGIGVTDPALSSMVRAGYLSVEQGRSLQSLGAVGDVCGHNFDLQGRLLEIPLAGYAIGISAETLRGLPRVIGVAGGGAKAPAILGALRSRLVNALVTDDKAARELLELAQPVEA